MWAGNSMKMSLKGLYDSERVLMYVNSWIISVFKNVVI